MWTRPDSRSLTIRLMVVAVLAACIVLLMILAYQPLIVERYYSQAIYPIVCHVLHPVFDLFPLSVGDLIYISIILYLIYSLLHMVKLLWKKSFNAVFLYFLKLVIGVQTAVLIFYVFWGMNYFRPSAGKRLNLNDSTYTTADLQVVTTILIDSANATRTKLKAADFKQDNSTIYEISIQAIEQLSVSSPYFYTYKPVIKRSILTPLLNYMGTTGYYNPFTGEAQVNYEFPVFDRPITACHELSHQMGYGPEDEANFVGFLAGIRSPDRLLRYSAYHLAVDEFMHALRYRDSTAQKLLKQRVSKAVHNDFLEDFKYWQRYQSQLEVISSIFYDNYLKVNNQPQGLNSYNRMVLLVMAMYKKG